MQDLHLLSKSNHDDMWYMACPHLCTLDSSGYAQPPYISRYPIPQADFLDCDLSKLPEHKKRTDYVKPPQFEVASNNYIHSHCLTLAERFAKQQSLTVQAVISLLLGLKWR